MADVRHRMSPPNQRYVVEIAREMGIHAITLSKWRKGWRLEGEVVPASEKEAESWSKADKFTGVFETAGLNAPKPCLYHNSGNLSVAPDRWPKAGLSSDFTYLPARGRGVWLYLFLVIDVWKCKLLGWDVADRGDSKSPADLVSQARLRELLSTRRSHPVILNAVNGNAMQVAH